MSRMNGRNPEYVTQRVWTKGALALCGQTPMTPAKPARMTADRAEMHLSCIALEAARKKSRVARRSMRGRGSLSVRIAARELGIAPDVFAVVAALSKIPGVKARTHTEFA